MQGVCSYPAVVSGPPLVSRVWEEACSLPGRGHWKATSFFPWKVFPVCQNFVCCLYFCSHHMGFPKSQQSTIELIFHTQGVCFQSSFLLSKQENCALLSIKAWSISYASRWLSLSIFIGLGSVVTNNTVRKRLQNLASIPTDVPFLWSFYFSFSLLFLIAIDLLLSP